MLENVVGRNESKYAKILKKDKIHISYLSFFK